MLIIKLFNICFTFKPIFLSSNNIYKTFDLKLMTSLHPYLLIVTMRLGVSALIIDKYLCDTNIKQYIKVLISGYQ